MCSASTVGMATVAPPLPIGRLVGVGLIIFFANAALLVLQLVAGRLLAPFIGSSLETWTSIIGVFLLGIALGNAFGGRVADRYPTPRTLAILLAIGAATAIWMVVFPQLLASSGAHKSIGLGPRIPILALVLCLPAGFALSLLTPLAIKLGLPDVSKTGRVAGMIFALSTCGCLLGNYLTGFVLFKHFTINTLAFFSAGVLAALAVGTMVFLQNTAAKVEEPASAGQQTAEVSPNDRANDPIPQSTNPHAFPDIRLAYAIVFLASFGGMTLELTASRVLAQYLGVSLFTWTGIIGVMLAGTALGNFTGGLFADRASQPGGMRRPLAILSAVFVGVVLFGLIDKVLPWASITLGAQLAIGGTSLAIIAVVGAIVGAWLTYAIVVCVVDEAVNPRTMLATTLMAGGAGTVLLFVIRTFLTQTQPFEEYDPIAQVIGWTFSLFFLPMFVLGMVSPQVIRLAVPDVAHVGRVAGRVYAWSTAGAIVGTFAAGYVLLSAFGMDSTLLLVALILTVTSMLVAKVWESNSMLYLFSIVLGGVTGGFILTSRGERDPNLIAKLETNYYTIKVTESRDSKGRPSGLYVLTLDHLIHSSVAPENPLFLYYEHEHIQMEFLWAARPGVPNPRALVIGGGGYTFPRYAMEVLPETRMDVVEIDPGVTRVARDFLNLKNYDGLNIVHMDGRQFVAEKVAPGTYDLVAQDAVNDLSVPSHLLTKEYNDAVKLTLKPDGTYLLTVIDSLKHGKLWRSAMRTLRETFSHVELVSSTEVPSETPPADATPDELKKWRAALRKFEVERQVLVIYAADRPLDVEKSLKEARRQLNYPQKAAIGMAVGAGSGFATGALFGALEHAASGFAFYTNVIPSARLAPFLAADPGILLTDQFAPVDNLMAEVFRYRYRSRPEDKDD
jgi:spermidine synthase/MFS family permease